MKEQLQYNLKEMKINYHIFSVAILILLVSCSRSEKRMEKLAYREVLLTASKSYRHDFDGPLKTYNPEFIEFVWYKELPFNDSALIYIEVPLMWNPFENKNIKVTMNNEWAYLEGAMSSFRDIYPFNTPEKLKIQVNKQNKDIEIRMLVSEDRLLYDIEKGFFEILKRTSKFSVISFYQPIVELEEISGVATKIISTSAAIISFNDSTVISITPISDIIARQY